MEDEEGGPPGFGPREALADADMFSMPPREDCTVDVSDSSAARRFKSFTMRVLKKVDSPLIQPPKQPPAKTVMSWRSERLATQSTCFQAR